MSTFLVVEQGVTVSKNGWELLIEKAGQIIGRTRLEGLESLQLFGNVEVTSGAVRACLAHGVDVAFLTRAGRYRGRLTGPASKNGARRLAQYARVRDEKFRLDVARSIVAGKVTSQRNLLLRGQRRIRDLEAAKALAQLRGLLEKIPAVSSHDELMGYEGQAAALYFGQFGKLILNRHFAFSKRTRRPPRDPVNACLSFGYMGLMARMDGLVQASGLDPMLGFLHDTDYGRPSLALDLIEEFRPVIVDALVLALVNKRQLTTSDFETDEPDLTDDILAGLKRGEGAESGDNGNAAVTLNDSGRRIFLSAVLKRLRQSLFYPPREATFSLADILDLQVQHLVRVIEGKEERYVPFVPR